LVKRDRFNFFLLAFLLVSVYFFLFSSSGLLERKKLNDKYDSLVKNLGIIKKENADLSNLIKKYDAGQVSDLDLFRSGYIKKGGIALIFDNVQTHLNYMGTENSNKISIIIILKITWIIFSILILYRFIKKRKNDIGDNIG